MSIASARFCIFFTLSRKSRVFWRSPISGSLSLSAVKLGGKTSTIRRKPLLSSFCRSFVTLPSLPVQQMRRLKGLLRPSELQGDVGQVPSAYAQRVGLLVDRLEDLLRLPRFVPLEDPVFVGVEGRHDLSALPPDRDEEVSPPVVLLLLELVRPRLLRLPEVGVVSRERQVGVLGVGHLPVQTPLPAVWVDEADPLFTECLPRPLDYAPDLLNVLDSWALCVEGADPDPLVVIPLGHLFEEARVVVKVKGEDVDLGFREEAKEPRRVAAGVEDEREFGNPGDLLVQVENVIRGGRL